MLRPASLFAALSLALLSACGSPPEPQTPPEAETPPAEAPKEETPPAEAPKEETPPAEPEATAPAAQESESEVLARDFLKTGGRRIGYSASKKSFAYPVEHRREDGFSLSVAFAGEDGKPKELMQVCQFGECAEKLDELAKEIMPKLASRLEQDGYVSIRSIGWPMGRDELEISTLQLKLKYTKGKLEALREGKPPATLGRIGAAGDTPEILAIFVVPDTKLLAVFAKPGRNPKNVVQELSVVKLP